MPNEATHPGAEEAALIAGEQPASHAAESDAEAAAAASSTTRPENPRDARLREIAARRAAEQGQQPEPAAAPGSEAEEPLQAPPAQNGPIVEKDGKTFLRVKVFGEENLMPIEHVQAQIQKGGAADARLNQATLALQQAETKRREAEALAHTLNQQLAQVRQMPNTRLAEDEEAQLEQALNKLLDSDVDGAKEAFKAILGRRNATPSIDEVAQTVRAQLARDSLAENEQNQKQAMLAALSTFESKYPDIAGDPRLFAYANAETDLIASESPGKTFEEIFLEAGRRVKEMVSKSAQDPNTRIETKRQMTKPVTGVARTASVGEPPARPPTTSEVIARMRAARGQN